MPQRQATAPGATAASGEQYELRHGRQAVTVVEVGGGIRAYTVGGDHVLDGYAPHEMCTGARGQTLVPWPNRIKGGAYSFGGRELQLPLTEPEKDNAIHGLLRWHSWAAVERSDTRVSLACRLHPQPGYPFTLDVRNDYELGDGGLTVRTVATNVGDRPCPYALGFHPYLSVGLDRIDEAVLHVPAEQHMPTDDAGIPVETAAVAGTAYDFRTPRPLGATEIDTTYARLERDAGGVATVTLAAPDGGRSVALWLGPAFPYVEIFTGDTLPEAEKRRTGLGVEPMTCPPDGFRTGTDLLVLAPGESAATEWGLRPAGW